MATQLKLTIELTNDCDLKIQDISGFLTDNATGFIAEATDFIPLDSYKISSGYFADVVTYNKYNAAPTIVTSSKLTKTASVDVNPVYTTNFSQSIYRLSQDSLFTAYRVFIISKEFYDLYKTTNRFDNKVVFYYDGTDIYRMTNDVPVKTTMGKVLSETADNTALRSSMKFASTCYLNLCYFKIMQELLLSGCDACEENDKMSKHRDFLYMSLEVIQYLKDLGNTNEIQRILESIDVCGGLCRDIVSTHSGCGCNG